MPTTYSDSSTNVNAGMNFNQLSTVLSSIVSQATGQAVITPVTTADFVSVAQTGLKTGVDPILGAINQVLSKTIFSIRPYSAKFRDIEWDSRKWGNHTRKINYGDTGFEEDNRLGRDVSGTFTGWANGDSADMFKIKKPVILQTNWYSQNQYQKHYTVFRDQLDTAFSGPDEFQRFITGMVSTVTDELEKAREEFSRAVIANYIGALYAQDASTRDSGRVIKLCTEFADDQGVTSDIGNDEGDKWATAYDYCMDPDNYDRFVKWLFARIAVISDLMTERSMEYQSKITISGSVVPIMRHTPYERQRMYLFTDYLKNIDTRVLSEAFHDSYLRIGKHSTVNYWQSIATRDSVKVVPATINAAGAYSANSSASATEVSKIFGILFDEEAIGITQYSTWSAPTVFNPAGGYTNFFYHVSLQGLNDLTEKGVLLLLA